jgi:signal transduction histidine kinase
MNRASRSLVLLLGLTVALAGLLAYEAQRATRSHRVTAERALRDYATVAALELATASAEALETRVAAALDPVVGSPAASPYDPLTPAASIASMAADLLPCAGPDSTRSWFAYDFSNGNLAVAGPTDPATEAWLRRAIVPAGRGAAVAWGRGPTEGRVAVYGVKHLRYSGYAVHDAPLAAYGVVTCVGAFKPLLAGAFEQHPLLPRSVSGGLPNAALAAVEVRTPDGAPLLRLGRDDAEGFAGDTVTAASGGPVFRAVLLSSVAGQLAVTRPASRLPLLLALLAVTAGLAGVALRQLRREEELARLRADFTSSVSHELRTPLTQILLYAETLELGRAGGEAERRRALGVIVQEARRLAHLVENILQFSRAERRMVLVRTEVRRLAPLLRETVERFAPIGGEPLRVELELEEALAAPVHPDSLRQVVINLLDNAAKYAGTGPVTVRARPVDGRARVEVEDAGPGIAPADRARVWEPYVRLQHSPAVAGSGIGLAVVRELTAAHGGACWVEEGTAGGARFVIELPEGRYPAAVEAA